MSEYERLQAKFVRTVGTDSLIALVNELFDSLKDAEAIAAMNKYKVTKLTEQVARQSKIIDGLNSALGNSVKK